MSDDPLLRVFDAEPEETATLVEPEAAEEPEAAVVEEPKPVVVEEAPAPKKRGRLTKSKPAAKKKATKKKVAKKVKEPSRLLEVDEVLSATAIIAKCGCNSADIHEACSRGEVVSTYVKCEDSGSFQFKYKGA